MPAFAGWAAQNEDNCDIIDDLFRKTEDTWVVNWTGSVSNPSVGSGGFTEGKYVWLTPHLIFGYFKINFGGAGFSAGTGVYGINLPVAPDPSLDSVNDGMPIGKGIYFDASSAASTTVFVTTYNPDTGGVYFSPPTGGAISQSSPFAAGQNDGISGYFWIPV